MKVEQIHEATNGVTKEVLGDSAVVNEDLSNVVDIGKEIVNSDNDSNPKQKLEL